MPPDARDAASLWDMLVAAEAIAGFVNGVSLDAYGTDRMLRRAVERELQIIGEAARRVSAAMRSQHQEVPWSKIIGLRNVLAHAYDEVDDERVWRVATSDVTELSEKLRPLLPPLPDGATS